jgi:starvation-inducible DNA-binding protein
MKTNINISEKNLSQVAGVLNIVLADEYVLYTKTRNAHWNIQGPNFMELHKFFEGQYEALDTIIDDVAERVRALGHFSLGALKDFLEVTRISEDEHNFSNAKQIIQTLLSDHESIIGNLRKEITEVSETYSDLGTADFLTGLMEQHEKIAWMLRAYIS